MSNPSTLSVGITADKVTDSADPLFGENGYTPELRIDYKYPLLRHGYSWESPYNASAHRRDILNLESEKLSFYETKESRLVTRLRDYLRWVQRYRTAQINGEFLARYKLLKPVTAADSALLDHAVNRIEQIDDDNEIKLDEITDKLAALLGAEIRTETPRFDLSKRTELLAEEPEAYLRAHSRSLAQTEINSEIHQIWMDYYENRSLPNLDFTAVVDRDVRNGSAYKRNRTDYNVGLRFSYPLGGRISTRASLQKEEIYKREDEKNYQDTLQNLIADINSLHALLALNEPQLLETISSAKQSAQLALQNYRARKTSLHDLLQTYLDWRAAEIDHLNKLIDYQMRSIEYDNILDRMIVTEQ